MLVACYHLENEFIFYTPNGTRLEGIIFYFLNAHLYLKSQWKFYFFSVAQCLAVLGKKIHMQDHSLLNFIILVVVVA